MRELDSLGDLLGLPRPRLAFFPDRDEGERIYAQDRLARGELDGLAGSFFALTRECQSPDGLAARRLVLVPDAVITRREISERFAEFGFKRVDMVENVGEFALRGQVVDCFGAAHAAPIRVLFRGDTVETLRLFDPISQESEGFLSEALILPVNGGQGGDLGAYLGQCSVVYEKPELAAHVGPWLAAQEGAVFGAFKEGALSFPVVANVPFAGSVKVFFQEAVSLAERGYSLRLAAPTLGDEERARELIGETAREAGVANIPIRWSVSALGGGCRDDGKKFWLVNTAEIFSRIPVRVAGPISSRRGAGGPKRTKSFQESLLELKLGDYVVHEIYGICRYRGLERVKDMEGRPHGEFLRLEFARSDRLFVNPEDLAWIHKYVTVGARQTPRLSSLDARSFEAVKGRVREDVRKFCQDLLKLMAKRSTLGAARMSATSHWEKEFAESFPYEETPDQIKAIGEVTRGMEGLRPMERLVVGDVGFGKTEVAIRAAFRAVTNGAQVCLLAPTTILADQHYRSFLSRFVSYPVSIGLFSRFTSSKDIKSSIGFLKKGRIDIAIGTHRLLSADVRFKNLGLLIVDEEHRFGVKAKERLKFLSATAHTLSLSATPIPRTLSSALSGIKDISVIESPPVGRLPIETWLGPWEQELAARAIRYELGRAGQVFYVLNDIAKLPGLARELEILIPGLRTAICHGQMSAAQVERAMQRFLEREIDVLVASSIIESGLDIPTVNTLIIEEAQNFGLAQLYQLRGRIGRKDVKAYAYFFYPRAKEWGDLSATAKERLNAIREFGELGCGMRLALRDLEIRGAGDMLGVRQHGFVSKVGLELYSKLIQEEMNNLRDDRRQSAGDQRIQAHDWPKVVLDIAAFLPEDYLPSEMERVSYYRRFSQCRGEGEIEKIFKELKDRCGFVPPEARELRALLRLRLAGRRLGLGAIEGLGEGRVRFEFSPQSESKAKLASWLLAEFPSRLRFETEREGFVIEGLAAPAQVLDFLTRAATQTGAGRRLVPGP